MMMTMFHKLLTFFRSNPKRTKPGKPKAGLIKDWDSGSVPVNRPISPSPTSNTDEADCMFVSGGISDNDEVKHVPTELIKVEGMPKQYRVSGHI